MVAGRSAEVFVDIRQHRFRHTWIDRSGGVIIQVDGFHVRSTLEVEDFTDAGVDVMLFVFFLEQFAAAIAGTM